jgi:hypothetical protein
MTAEVDTIVVVVVVDTTEVCFHRISIFDALDFGSTLILFISPTAHLFQGGYDRGGYDRGGGGYGGGGGRFHQHNLGT